MMFVVIRVSVLIAIVNSISFPKTRFVKMARSQSKVKKLVAKVRTTKVPAFKNAERLRKKKDSMKFVGIRFFDF